VANGQSDDPTRAASSKLRSDPIVIVWKVYASGKGCSPMFNPV